MRRLDYYTAAAIQGLLARPDGPKDPLTVAGDALEIAKAAEGLSDPMLSPRTQKALDRMRDSTLYVGGNFHPQPSWRSMEPPAEHPGNADDYIEFPLPRRRSDEPNS